MFGMGLAISFDKNKFGGIFTLKVIHFVFKTIVLQIFSELDDEVCKMFAMRLAIGCAKNFLGSIYTLEVSVNFVLEIITSNILPFFCSTWWPI